jgi:hypothetical protein
MRPLLSTLWLSWLRASLHTKRVGHFQCTDHACCVVAATSWLNSGQCHCYFCHPFLNVLFVSSLHYCLGTSRRDIRSLYTAYYCKMSFPGQQQGGGQPGGAGFAGQSSPNQPTTTSSTTAHTSTLSSHSSPTSNSASPGVHKSAIIGGIVGGVAGLLLISLLGVWLLNRRKKRQSGARARKTQPVTYSSLNSVFRGVPFNRSNSQSPHDSLLPQSQVSQSSNSNLSGVVLRGGAASYGQRDSGSETDNLPPSYAESQMRASMASLGRLRPTHSTNSDTIVSPLSPSIPEDADPISPQTTGTSTFMSLQRLWHTNEPTAIPSQTPGASAIIRSHTSVSEQTQVLTPQPTEIMPALVQQRTRDTMGFPIEPEEIRMPPAMPSIVAPVPRHPLVQQDSLERVVREGLMPSESPEPGNLNPARLRVLSQEMPRESPILGLNSVRIAPDAATNDGVRRNDTQRTISSVSSMGISVVSDGELERLGVGVDSSARYHQPTGNDGS